MNAKKKQICVIITFNLFGGFMMQDLGWSQQQKHGLNDLKTAVSLDSLGSVLHNQGKYTAAEPLLRRALEICEGQLGPEHPRTKETRNNLANVQKLLH